MVTFNPYDLPTEGVLLTETNTRAFLEDKDCGNGTLCISEKYVIINELNYFIINLLDVFKV